MLQLNIKEDLSNFIFIDRFRVGRIPNTLRIEALYQKIFDYKIRIPVVNRLNCILTDQRLNHPMKNFLLSLNIYED